jgi:undecaprenyl-diphosphatase
MHTPALQDKIQVLTSGGEYGTVSGHAATLTAITLLSSLAIRRRWFVWMMVAVAITVCYSRIYLAYHFPIDIALGVATGLLSGATGWFFYKWSIKRWCK